MISYKLLTQEHYANLSKVSVDFLSQRSFLIQKNSELMHKIHETQQQSSNLQLQLKEQKSNNNELSSRIDQLQKQLAQMSQKLSLQVGKQIQLIQQKNETTIQLKVALNGKNNAQIYSQSLQKKISLLQVGIIALNRKNKELLEKQKLLQSRITMLDQSLEKFNSQKVHLITNVHQKSVIIQNLNIQLNIKSELIQKIVSQYQACKEQKLNLQTQIKKFQQSPIPKLQEKIQANQTWINELTKVVNQLKHRCVELQMDRPHQNLTHQTKNNQVFNYPNNTTISIASPAQFSIARKVPADMKSEFVYTKIAPSSILDQKAANVAEQTFFTNRSRFEQTQRLKYLAICKQLVQQFTSKLSKIQQQKKTMEERYQSIKLKLNDYQYNEFKYRDKISMYLKKIERYEKLTQKQQSEIQNLILEFDQEVNNVIKRKEEEVKSKLEEQIFKYQQELQRLKQEEEMTKKLGQEAYEELVKHQEDIDCFEYEILKQEMEQAVMQLGLKTQEVQRLEKNLHKATKELQKYKESKQSYKEKAANLQEKCHNYSIQVRQLKKRIQQLCKQLLIKTNQNEILKSTFFNNSNRTNRSNNANSRLECNSELFENLSAKLSLRNHLNSDKRSGSDHFEYQVSQIDTELQKRNEFLLSNILIKKRNQNRGYQINGPAGPLKVSQHSDHIPNTEDYWSRVEKPSLEDSLNSINKSQISSQSENNSGKDSPLNSGNNSPNGSYSSKNSYQSYGIRNLYKEKVILAQTQGQRYLLHKNSLQ